MRAGAAGHAPTGVDREELRRWYEAYRRRQARRLVDLVPREAIRPLYRAASRDPGPAPSTDPLERLVSYCGALLPLPPFDIWIEDLARNPGAHLRDWDDTVEVPTVGEPATLATRTLRRGREEWGIRLRAYAHEGAWRAHLTFEGPTVADTYDTAVVFHEASPGDLMDRFLGFEDSFLEGFLRSCLP